MVNNSYGRRNKKEEIITGILKSCIKYNDIDDAVISENLATFSSNEKLCRAYPEISKIIYQLSAEEFDDLQHFFGISDANDFPFEGLRQQEQLDGLSEKRKNNLNRFERHVRLSYYQRRYINKMANDAQRSAIEAEETSKNASKVANDASNSVIHIYSEFVGILAIFTAISFATMGSFQMLGSVFNNIKHPTQSTLGYALILAGIYLIVIYLLIMTLVLAMKKLFEVKKTDYKFSKPFVVIVGIVFAVLIIVGIALVI